MEREDKIKICSLVAHAIISDGHITDDERQFIEHLMSRFALTQEERKSVLDRDLDEDAVSLVEGIQGFESRNALMVELVMAVAADGVLSATERHLLDVVANTIGVDPADMDMLVKNALM